MTGMTGQCSVKLELNSSQDNKFLDSTKLKAFASDKKWYLLKGRKHFGKRRKCWLQAFPPFFTMFSKVFFFWVVKASDCLVKRIEKTGTSYGNTT